MSKQHIAEKLLLASNILDAKNESSLADKLDVLSIKLMDETINNLQKRARGETPAVNDKKNIEDSVDLIILSTFCKNKEAKTIISSSAKELIKESGFWGGVKDLIVPNRVKNWFKGRRETEEHKKMQAAVSKALDEIKAVYMEVLQLERIQPATPVSEEQNARLQQENAQFQQEKQSNINDALNRVYDIGMNFQRQLIEWAGTNADSLGKTFLWYMSRAIANGIFKWQKVVKQYQSPSEAIRGIYEIISKIWMHFMTSTEEETAQENNQQTDTSNATGNKEIAGLENDYGFDWDKMLALASNSVYIVSFFKNLAKFYYINILNKGAEYQKGTSQLKAIPHETLRKLWKISKDYWHRIHGIEFNNLDNLRPRRNPETGRREIDEAFAERKVMMKHQIDKFEAKYGGI